MNWRIDDHPEGGLQITHLVAPRFTARWTTGAFPIEAVREGAFFWTDEGGGEDDAIHLWGFVLEEDAPPSSAMERLLAEAVMAIERFISDGW
jgi:hypothetical protein